jgi:hypothetical protein
MKKKYFLMLIAGIAFAFALVLNVKVAIDKPVKVTNQLEVAKAMDPDWCLAGGWIIDCYYATTGPNWDGNDFYAVECGTCNENLVSEAYYQPGDHCINPICLAW